MLTLHYEDLTDDGPDPCREQVQPDEIYEPCGASHVGVSFETPEYTTNADAVEPLRILEVIRILGMEKRTRIYQASTSEMFRAYKRHRSARRRHSIHARLMARPRSTPIGSP